MSQDFSLPSPSLFFDAVNAYQRSSALKAAIELNLFHAIAQGSGTPPDLSVACDGSERGLRILCDFLTTIGFLSKQDETYTLTRDSTMFLDPDSPGYVGDAIQYLLNPAVTQRFDDVAGAVRSGCMLDSRPSADDQDSEIWKVFARAMTPSMAVLSRVLLSILDLDRQQKLKVLDLGAGHGMFGIAVANQCPQATVTSLDLPGVLDVARDNATSAKLGERFSMIAGDVRDVDFGEGYDLAILANTLHLFDRETCVNLLRKTHASLAEGGRAVVVDFIPNEDRVSPPAAASFSLMMLVSTAGGDAYTLSEFDEMFRLSGYSKTSLHAMHPADHSVLIAVK